jgi:hypothetical protein
VGACVCVLLSVDRVKYQIHLPLPPKIDPTVTMMQVLLTFQADICIKFFCSLLVLKF